MPADTLALRGKPSVDPRSARPFSRSIPHRIWQLLPPGFRRTALTHATAYMAPRPDRVPCAVAQGVAVAGEFSRASGLGEGARLMASAAHRLGLPVWRVDVPPPVDAAAELEPPGDATPLTGAPLIVHVNAPLMPLALLRLPRALPRGRRMIGYWAWELPTVPTDWLAGARFVHEIWVPSRFTAAALERLMPGKIRVVPPPLADVPPVPSQLDRAAFGLPEDAVIVLVSFNLASSFARKNPLGAVAAFRAAFGDRSDRMLLLKVGHADHAPRDFARLCEAVAHAPNIRLETSLLPPADRHALTAACDIVLSLHRGEGFGLVPAEAMLLGKPVIATGWSGNLDFMDTDNAALVGYRLVPTQDDRMVYRDSVWAEPNMGDAVGHLRRLADGLEARRALGARARQTALERLTSKPLALAMRGIGLHVPA